MTSHIVHTGFYYNERKHHIRLLLYMDFFEDARGGADVTYFNDETNKDETKNCIYILQDKYRAVNLYPGIRDEALDYFNRYGIAWWRLKDEKNNSPSGHLLSSQVCCLNHLFALRTDPEAVLAMIKPLGETAGVRFTEVLPSFIDKKDTSYIAFEFVSGNKTLLKEDHETRGTKCTSVDALVYALTDSGERWLIPIEWKYTEAYDHKETAENYERYLKIFNSSAATSRLTDWGRLFEADPFYELGRQTLFMERIISERPNGIQADNFLHVVVIPEANREMNKDASDFKGHIKDEAKKLVQIITPIKLLTPVKTQYEDKYRILAGYLKERYWH